MYDEIAPYYQNYFKKFENYHESVNKLVLDHLKPHYNLLDIGSGDGVRIKYLIDESCITNYVCTEPSEQMYNKLSSLFGEKAYQMDATSLSTLSAKFDCITMLWNVLGHISRSSQLTLFANIFSLLKPNGIVMFDVNNRYNMSSYGFFECSRRLVYDYFFYDWKNGDTKFSISINEQTIAGNGHIFTPFEIEKLYSDTNLKLKLRKFINYRTGSVSNMFFKGQAFYVLSK